jgi:putative addiction module killer protein
MAGYTILQTEVFDGWLRGLKDHRARQRIAARIRHAGLGHFGDVAHIGDGVSEMRIHYGPGYRLYFMRRGETVYLLLCGGDKSSQKRDIKLAKQIAADIVHGSSS